MACHSADSHWYGTLEPVDGLCSGVLGPLQVPHCASGYGQEPWKTKVNMKIRMPFEFDVWYSQTNPRALGY